MTNNSKTEFRDGERLQSFTAVGQIMDDEPYQVEMSEGFTPFRRKVSFVVCKEAPIRPLLDDLEFVPDKKKWGFPFQRGLFMIEKSDFVRIVKAMNYGLEL
jgi:hypothetical protein